MVLRRTRDTKYHGKPLVPLPEKQSDVLWVKLTEERRAKYRAMCSCVKLELVKRQKENKGKKNVAYAQWVNQTVFRHRRWIDHEALLDDEKQSAVDDTDERTLAEWDEEQHAAGLTIALKEAHTCCGCSKPWSKDGMFITPCEHALCKECYSAKRHYKRCLMRRCSYENAGAKAVFSHFLRSAASDERWRRPPHVWRAINNKTLWTEKPSLIWDKMQEHLAKDPEVKFVIVSIWTAPLDILAECFRGKGDLTVGRFQGNTSREERDEIVKRFRACGTEDAINTLLLSMQCGGVGLNLTVGKCPVVMFLYEPDYNPANELQVEGRVDRIGAKGDINIYRLITEDSVEEGVRKIQMTKQAIINGTFAELNESGIALERQEQLIEAYEVVDDERLAHTYKRRREEYLDQ
ncbi:hypothetical protein CALVIDRAFT_543543 [Calocera viscosa TUFC12733]|uniref:Helicase C-terminal domain-containing protein n=1 Tax=Calocera viscosa (strain TUFC12733) TaxID=1330018 RepID=A0A167FFU7_CALVF|nr:hypothetical protein CALVIDRAFT_543543 [Calocera viscosa TUFC12733]